MNTKTKTILVMLITVCLMAYLGVFNIVNATDVTTNIKLENDSTEQLLVKSGSNVIIDLNGHNLNVNGDAIVVESGATATIKGNGTVEATKGAIVNLGGTVTVESGNFNSSSWYTVKNLGVMTINGGTFTQGKDNKPNSSLIANGWYNGKGTHSNDKGVTPPTGNEATAILTINGGTFTHYTTTSTIKSDDWSKTTITAGNFTSANGTLIQATGDVTVSGGEFKGFYCIALFNGDGSEGYEPAKLNISNGTFSANYVIWPSTSGTLDISGGTFNDISSFTCPGTDYTKNITGGTYNIDIKSDVANSYTTYNVSGKYVVDKAGTISTTSDEIVVKKGATKDLGISVDNGLSKYLTVTSEDSNIATVDNGTVTGVNVGTTAVTATLADGTSKTVNVVVYEVTEASETTENQNATSIVNDVVDKILSGEDVSILTVEQKEAIQTAASDGKVLVVDVTTSSVENTTVKDDAAKVESVLKDGAKVAGYYDINFVIKDDKGNEITKLTDLDREVKVTISIPSDLAEVEKGYTRTYSVVRVHDGVAEELATTNNGDGTLTFSSSAFSTYAVTYVDSASNTDTTENPQTGDNIIMYIALLGISVLGIAITFKKIRK